uniref:gamma-glutamylcyclotransferase family protein n=1 Tax=Yoonia sp. TaxID=2212373 RepID=UPI004048B45B
RGLHRGLFDRRDGQAVSALMDIFIYGTLMSPDLRRAVAGGAQISTVAAELDGYEVLPAAGHVVPLIRAAPAGRTTGQIMLDIDAAQRARLDAYESAFGYRLIEVAVRTAKRRHHRCKNKVAHNRKQDCSR